MSDTVLVTFATRYGSTREVAEFIGKQLIQKGLAIEILPCKIVSNIEKYDFIILGTPYYIGNMLKDAKNFIINYQDELTKKPVAIFALGPIGDTEKEIAEARNQLENELKQYSWLQPVATEMFGGKYDPETLRFLDKLLTKPPASPLHNLQANDARNWTLIEDWIKKLPVN